MNALVLSCGGSIEPLVESILEYEPDLVYFIHSEQSFYQAMYILSIFNYDLIYNCKLVKNYQDIEDVFVKSREVIKELKEKDYQIRIDFTGGTKTMSAGLVLASIGQGCKHSYIGSEDLNGRDKNGLGIVLDGYEVVTEQKDPIESRAVLEFNKGKLFFDEYQFKAAKKNFDDAKEKSKSYDLKKIAKIYSNIVELYDLWDKFDIKKSKNVMLYQSFETEILKKIETDEYLNNHFSNEYPMFINQIEKNINFLKIKISDKKQVNKDNINYYLPDLLNNAQRRIEEEKYDDAVARLYRAIELIAQIKLTRKGLIDEKRLKGKVFKIKKSEIDNLPNDLKIKGNIQSWFEYKNSTEVFKVGLCKNYLILDGLGVDFAQKYVKDINIQNNVNLRNGSILAHGLNRIKDKKAKRLMEQVLDYAKCVCPNVEKLMQEAKFPKFNDK